MLSRFSNEGAGRKRMVTCFGRAMIFPVFGWQTFLAARWTESKEPKWMRWTRSPVVRARVRRVVRERRRAAVSVWVRKNSLARARARVLWFTDVCSREHRRGECPPGGECLPGRRSSRGWIWRFGLGRWALGGSLLGRLLTT